MNCSSPNPFPIYRIVQNLTERNTIPCDERMRGMLVTVIQASAVPDESGFPPPAFTQYMLQGVDICNNTSWVKYSVDNHTLSTKVGHKTEEQLVAQEITNQYLNNKYPKVLEGFQVTITPLNSTFMKVSADRWVLTNNFLNDV